MLPQQVGRSIARMLSGKNVSIQARRTLYPHYLRYMTFNVPGHAPISFVEKTGVLILFMAGIFGPPGYIMYEVGQIRKQRGE